MRTNTKRPWLAFYRISNELCSCSMISQTSLVRALFKLYPSPIIFQTGSIRVLFGSCLSPKRICEVAESKNTVLNR
ncbi:hypothetical protein LEP1GSC188_0550 [Leptospira weilii serovar Topaz str. LT2116]|uniref:Uncharacterized protein n=1 Tax=Leptospira weilii serovar Topaz str. LT2116 TaxID=1088540 RepID=M3GU84_9LEPT|nr:hypothetical protein LEP1GSC188_0550 [Leptospira weilii serovar Topaz str. LT2116]